MPSFEMQPALEQKEKMSLQELAQSVLDQATKVGKALQAERLVAAAIRQAGGGATLDSARDIQQLEKQFQALVRVQAEVVEPQMRAWSERVLHAEPGKPSDDIVTQLNPEKAQSSSVPVLDIETAMGGLVEKPLNFAQLMSEPGYEAIPDEELEVVELTSEDLVKQEATLRFEATNIRQEMSKLIDRLNELGNRFALVGPLEMMNGPQGKIKDAEEGIIRTTLSGYYKRLGEIRKELTEIKVTLRMVRETEASN